MATRISSSVKPQPKPAPVVTVKGKQAAPPKADVPPKSLTIQRNGGASPPPRANNTTKSFTAPNPVNQQVQNAAAAATGQFSPVDFVNNLAAGIGGIKGFKDGVKNPAAGAQTGVAIGSALGSIVPGVGTVIGGAVGGALGAIAELMDHKEHPDTLKRKEIKNAWQAVMGNNLEFPTADGKTRSLHKYNYNVDFQKPQMGEAVATAMALGRIMAGGSNKFGHDMTGIIANAIYDPSPQKMKQNARHLAERMQLYPQNGLTAIQQLYTQGKVSPDEARVMVNNFANLFGLNLNPNPSAKTQR